MPPAVIGLLLWRRGAAGRWRARRRRHPDRAPFRPFRRSPAGDTAREKYFFFFFFFAGRAPTLDADALADECLLNATQFGELLDLPVRPEQAVVRRADGTRSFSCFVTPADGQPAPLAAINVYRVRSGTPPRPLVPPAVAPCPVSARPQP